VCDFCHLHLEDNKAAFESDRLELIHDDARAQLEVGARRSDCRSVAGRRRACRLPAHHRCTAIRCPRHPRSHPPTPPASTQPPPPQPPNRPTQASLMWSSAIWLTLWREDPATNCTLRCAAIAQLCFLAHAACCWSTAAI